MLDCSDFHLYTHSIKEKSLNLRKTKRADMRSISKVHFGYNTILDEYPQLTADINKLLEMGS